VVLQLATPASRPGGGRETDDGRRLLTELLKEKLVEQARLANELLTYRSEKEGRDWRSPDSQGAIAAEISCRTSVTQR
jgi:hypothetical protein